MRVYVVYPTPWRPHEANAFDLSVLPALQRLGVFGVRVNLHPRSTENDTILSAVAESGLKVLPILDLEYDGSVPVEDYARWCAEISDQHRFLRVELGNEPWTTGHVIGGRTVRRMPAAEYAAYVRAASVAIHDRVSPPPRIAVACDACRPNGYRHRDWERWWFEVRRALPLMAWDEAAIHPYRSLPPTASRIEWASWMHRVPSFSEWLAPSANMRPTEHRWWRETARAPLIVTETGWSRRNVSDDVGASYLREELEFYAAVKMPLVCVYAHAGEEFGVLNPDGSPRLQGDAIRRFVEAHP